MGGKPVTILPMQLQVGDRFTDEEDEWELADHPFTMPVFPNTLRSSAGPPPERDQCRRSRVRGQASHPCFSPA